MTPSHHRDHLSLADRLLHRCIPNINRSYPFSYRFNLIINRRDASSTHIQLYLKRSKCLSIRTPVIRLIHWTTQRNLVGNYAHNSTSVLSGDSLGSLSCESGRRRGCTHGLFRFGRDEVHRRHLLPTRSARWIVPGLSGESPQYFILGAWPIPPVSVGFFAAAVTAMPGGPPATTPPAADMRSSRSRCFSLTSSNRSFSFYWCSWSIRSSV